MSTRTVASGVTAPPAPRSPAPRSRAPGLRLERRLAAGGRRVVAGIDEVGRGAWAGPATVGVVVPPPDRPPPRGLRDSKLLAEARREVLAPEVARWAVAWAVGHATPGECDELGMTAALRLAAHRALDALDRPPDVVLLDGAHDYLTDPEAAGTVRPEVHPVVGGDRRCASVAAASVLAKVVRDGIMRETAPSFPPFEFDRNKGYPSPVHRTALAGYGLTSIHRRSWSYVDALAFR